MFNQTGETRIVRFSCAAVLLVGAAAMGQNQTYEKAYDYTKFMHWDITNANGNRVGGPESGQIDVLSHCFVDDRHGSAVLDTDQGQTLDVEIRDIWTHLEQDGNVNNDRPDGPVNMRSRIDYFDQGTLPLNQVRNLYDWEREFYSGGGHARSRTRNLIRALYRQEWDPKHGARHKVDCAVTIQGGVTVNANLHDPETAAAQSIAFSYASFEGVMERAEWVGPNGKIVEVEVDNPDLLCGLTNVQDPNATGTRVDTVIIDPVRLSFFDDANMTSLGSSVVYQNEFRASGRASIEWRPNQDLILIAGADGVASAMISTPSGWVVNPFNGSASIIDGVFAAEGMFAGLPWTVVEDQGILTARLASSAIPHDFNFVCNAADAGNPVGDVIRQLESDVIGGAKDLKTAPDPAGIAVMAIGGGSLILRRRRVTPG